jgi:hypothetical protein
MGSQQFPGMGKRASLGARTLALCALATLFVASPARAQHADAGTERQATRPAAPPEAKPPTEASGILPKAIDPSVLSEGARASLQERSGGRLPPNLQSPRPELGQGSSRLTDSPFSGGAPGLAARQRLAEPVRRGEAHQRRVQALETAEGITLLSNRIHPLPEPRVSPLVARTSREPIADSPPDQPSLVASSEPANVTETRSLRPGAAHLASSRSGTGLGWLLWPFVLFVTTGAVVGTLWFRKKTQ